MLAFEDLKLKMPHEGERVTDVILNMEWHVDYNNKPWDVASLEIHTEEPCLKISHEEPCLKFRRYAMLLDNIPTEASIDDTIFHLTAAPDLSIYEVEFH